MLIAKGGHKMLAKLIEEVKREKTSRTIADLVGKCLFSLFYNSLLFLLSKNFIEACIEEKRFMFCYPFKKMSPSFLNMLMKKMCRKAFSLMISEH